MSEPTAQPSLDAFLRAYLGDWPPHGDFTVVGSTQRRKPGWDGAIRDVVGVGTPDGGVVSVPPEHADVVREAIRSWPEAAAKLPAAVGRPGASAYVGKFRWTLAPTALSDAGTWIDVEDPRVPEWLRPFGGQALIALENNAYAAGVGIKRHNSYGLELSVGTDEEFRGRGLASRLVAQAARWVLAQGAVPIYLHDPANIASDRTARAAGFPDLGWEILGMSPRPS
jgi:GNAT superfamily N-acetyltransferase